MKKEYMKELIDKGVFDELQNSVLHDKLLLLLRSRLDIEDKENTSYVSFSHYCNHNGRITTNEDASCYSYISDSRCDEDDWCWFLVTGPNDISEYGYIDYFNKSPCFFSYVYQFYNEIFRGRNKDESDRIVSELLECKTYKELDEIVENYCRIMGGVAMGIEEVAYEYGFCFEGNDILKEIVLLAALSGYYIWMRQLDENISQNVQNRMETCVTYIDKVMEEIDDYENVFDVKSDIESYLDYFINEMEDVMNCSLKGKRVFFNIILDAHFSFSVGHHGNTPTAYLFSSKHMQKYKNLRETNQDHPLVPYLDKLISLLEDPLVFSGEKYSFDGYLGENECCMECSYTGEEYICAYYFFDSFVYDREESVKFCFSPMFKVARVFFMKLFDEFIKTL